MEDIEAIGAALGEIVSYDDFFEVRSQLDEIERERLFRALWTLAIQRSLDGSAGMAGYMLAELQPSSDLPLDVLVAEIDASGLDASNRIVPFYLVSEFGKHLVLEACARFLNRQLHGSPRSRVEAVSYWASMPASELCKQFHDWEARDMYGVPDDI